MARPVITGALALAGVFSIAQGAWIPIKAALAQVLLDNAWRETLHSSQPLKPWPWADTWPVARLSAPAQDKSMVVLAGASGATLAFGPAHVRASAPPGSADNTVIVGHRDTHFAFLQKIKPGAQLQLESADGVVHHYRVNDARVLHETDTDVLAATGSRLLTLITCYPFDAIIPGGPLRYVVRAQGITGHNPTLDKKT